MSIAEQARISPEECHEFDEVSGRGVRGLVNGQEVLVGRESFLAERGVGIDHLDTSATEGLSLLFVARDGHALGWVGLADTPREDAAESVKQLEKLGIARRVMITGDRQSAAHRAAAGMALTDIHAEALPGDKLQLVEDLKKRGHTVAVIGDGVNDAPALAAGHVSLAMGAAGSDVAVHNANIALMNNNLDRLPFLVRLSRRTLNVIRQNLAFTLGYILFMLVLLAIGARSAAVDETGAGWANYLPIIAAIGHGVSSIIVVFNSARLIREGEEVEFEEAEPHPWETVEPTTEAKPATA
jgi:Cd2+/Zn2+-exporting ATPase